MKGYFMKRILLLSAVAAAVVTMPLLNAEAATFTVTKTTDTADGICDADCSLREAVIAANANAGADIIEVKAGTYTLTRSGFDTAASLGDLDILQDIAINGAGAGNTIIDGNQSDDIFHVATGVSATFSKMTLRNGKSTNYNFGGGILSAGNLTIDACSISDNSARLGGAGIYCESGTDVLVDIRNSTIANNTLTGTGGSGGGFYGNGCLLNITNSTFSANSATANGGGITNNRLTKLANVTLSDNTADSDGDDVGDGGGIYMSTAVMRAKNTLLAGNHDLSPSADIHPDCSTNTVPTSDGYNLIGIDGNCAGTAFSATNHDVIGTLASPVNPLLTLLASKGGGTLVHAFLAGSPALDAGNPAGCTDYSAAALTEDQRGFARPVGARCDIGAFEQGDCGDGAKDPGEACDDGNTVETDACLSTCELATCGDGFVQAGVEECDDGNTNDGDGCSADCKIEAAATTGGGTTGGETTGDGTTGGTAASEPASGGCSLVR